MSQISLNKIEAIFNNLIAEEIGRWPSPVSTRMALFLEEDIARKILGTVAFLDSLSSFLGSILISLYINDPEKKFASKALNQAIFDFFKKPATLGQWIGILRESLKYFKKFPDFFMPELLNFASGIEDPLKISKDKIKIVKINGNGLLDELNPFRLGVGHPEKLPEYLKKYLSEYEIHEDIMKHYKQALPRVIPDLFRLIHGLKFLSHYWLFYIENLREEDGESIAGIHLYSSLRPRNTEIEVTGVIKEFLQEGEFKASAFRYKLFLARVAKRDVFSTNVERMIEVNPIFINLLREKERERKYLPHRFIKWNRIEKKEVLMGDIISHYGEETVDHPDTCNRLWDIYTGLKKKLKKPSDRQEEEVDEEATSLLTITQSKQSYNEARKEIYPHLNIVDEILAGIGYEREIKEETIDVQVSLSGKTPARLSLRQAVEKLWDSPEKWHSVLLGEGGTGKTTSLLKLWESFLSGNEDGPIPVFIRLETYNQIGQGRREDFIWYAIADTYHGRTPYKEEIKILENQFRKRMKIHNREIPSVILLLDGFNEVTSDREDLLKCLNKIKNFDGVQIILSSRYDMRSYYNWSEFEGLNLEPLEDEQIKTFMSSQKIEFNLQLVENIPLLRNPMMLTLYCGMEREMRISSGKEDYDFIPEPRYRAEIIHNFIVSSLARLDRSANGPGDKILHRLYLRHLLPEAGYEMEKRGLFEIEQEKLIDIINDELKKYCSIQFLKEYPDLSEHIDEIMNKIEPDSSRNVFKIIRNLREHYCLFKKMGGSNYAFLHQYFRDYFSAVYIRNKTAKRIEVKDSNFPELSCRVFETHLRSMLGELTGEPRRRPFIKEGNYHKGEIEETVFDHALDLLRNRLDKEDRSGNLPGNVIKLVRDSKDERIDYCILNILEILKETRIDLSNTDLSYLDLRNIVLNNVKLGHGKIDGKERGAILKGSRIRAYTFLPHGHSDVVHTVRYNSDGKKILSGSFDKTVKEWNVKTGECIRTYESDFKELTCAGYSPDEKKIVAAGESKDWDEIIKEWDVESGECIKEFKGYSGRVYSISYRKSYFGEQIVSGGTGKINLWRMETGLNIRTYYIKKEIT